MPQVVLTFGQLRNLRGLVFPMNRGVTPSVFTLYMYPQDGLDVGAQTLSFGVDTNVINLSNCLLSTAFLRKNWDQKWPVWCVCGFDRRWKWRFSNVSGDYNRRKADGTLDTTTQQTPGQLATLIGQALGETIDVSRMPTGVWPRALWKNQRADLVLQWLCDYVACEVVLNVLTDKVEIWPLGQGQSTPTNNWEMNPKVRYVPRTNIPSIVTVHCGDSLFQNRLKLSAAARNFTDGKQKLLASVDTKPADFTVESPFSWPSQTDNTKRAMEFEQFYRDFRIVGQQDGTVQVPQCQAAVSAIDQYILNDTLLDVETDLEGYARQLPCYLDGDYWAYTDLPNNASSMRFTGGFTFYKDRRLVNTAFPVFKLSSTGAYQEPALYLTTSYKVQDTTHQIVHVTRSGNVGGVGGTLNLKRPEIFATYSSSTLPGAQATTESQANSEADNYCTLFQQKYSVKNACEMTYGGFYNGTLDGNIAQATWTILPTRVTTMVCEQEELDTSSVSLNERARRMALDRLTEAAA